jgi:copper(I)-binding protein
MKRLLLAAAVLAAPPAATVARAQTPTIQVDQPWARATPGHATSGAVYFTVTDHGAADHITGVSTPAAGMAMLHQSFVENGVSKMRMLDDLALQPDKPVVLKPSGIHVMLEELQKPLKVGDTFPLTVTFATAPPVTVTVTVLKAGAMGPLAAKADAPMKDMPMKDAPAMKDMPGMNGTQ